MPAVIKILQSDIIEWEPHQSTGGGSRSIGARAARVNCQYVIRRDVLKKMHPAGAEVHLRLRSPLPLTKLVGKKMFLYFSTEKYEFVANASTLILALKIPPREIEHGAHILRLKIKALDWEQKRVILEDYV